MEPKNQDKKKILVYLYEHFNGDQNKILMELIENNLKPSMEVVNEFIKSRGIKLTNYTALWENEFPKQFRYEYDIFIYYNKIEKYLDVVLEDDNTPNGGVSYQGQTLREFLDEIGVGQHISVPKANKILVENGIKSLFR